MPIRIAIRNALERQLAPTWPFGWMAREEPEVLAAYRSFKRSYLFVCVPVLLAVFSVLLIANRMHLSEETANIRFGLGLLSFLVAFVGFPAYYAARFLSIVVGHLRRSDGSRNIRLAVVAATLLVALIFMAPASLVLLWLVAASIAGSVA
jgi:hypothetical protein